MPKVEFRDFQEQEARNKAFLAKLYTQRRDTEVGMVVAYHLGDRLGIFFYGLGTWHSRSEILCGNRRWVRDDVSLPNYLGKRFFEWKSVLLAMCTR